MSIGDLFWLFFFLSALQPVLQRRMMEEARTRLLRRLEQQRGSRVITLIHRQETMSFLGFPLVRYLDIEDSEEILRAIHLTPPEMPIDLVVHTPGGLVLAAAQVALEGTLPEDRVERVAKTLTSGSWTHDYPLTVSEARPWACR